MYPTSPAVMLVNKSYTKKSLKINFNIKYKGELSKEDIIKLLTDNYKNITDIS